jgi:rhamnosyltransferase
VNSIGDAGVKGLKAAFLSNSFAAYRISSLLEIGGFPDNVIFGEDMYVATKFLKAGYDVAYAAEASVYHSHNYSLWQEMKRYFDMGVFHAREPWIMQELGGAEGEGFKFVVSEYKYLLRHAFWYVPEGLLRTLFRYSGFRLGLIEKRLPLWLKRTLAMNKGYFKR